MPVARLKKFLDEHEVRYTTTTHAPAYTALEVAQAAHVPGKELAKIVMVKFDGELGLAVIPASEQVNLESLAAESGSKTVTRAKEEEFEASFPGCEVGAMPPFGNLWNLPVYASKTLAEDEIISFCAGNHHEVMSLAFDDFRRLAEPKILRFSKPL